MFNWRVLKRRLREHPFTIIDQSLFTLIRKGKENKSDHSDVTETLSTFLVIVT